MNTKRAQMGIIFLTIFIDMVGFGIVIPVLPLYAEHFGASAVQNGLLVAAFSFAQFFASPVWGKISDRVGRKPVLFVSLLGTAIGFVFMGLAGELWVLFAARLLAGFCGGNIGTAQAYIADITTREERAKAMGLIGAAFGLGFVFGPAIGGIVGARYGFAAPMYVAAALSLISAILVWRVLPESLPPERRGIGAKESIFAVFDHADARIYQVVTSVYFFIIAGFSMMTFVFALFIYHRFDMDAAATGKILAMVGLIGVVIQGGLIGRLVKAFGEIRLAITGGIILAGSLCLLPLTSTLAGLLWASAGVAIGNSLLTPTLTGLASRSVDQDWQGRALGLFQSAGSLARWIGPAAAGFLLALDVGKPIESYARTPLWTGAVLVFIATALMLLIPARRVQPSEPVTAGAK
jgi:multidrug resistance protein